MKTTTYIAVNGQTGNTAGTETAERHEALLDVLRDRFGEGLEFRREGDGAMYIFDGEQKCFSAVSVLEDDAAARQQCLDLAFRDCSNSQVVLGEVLELARDATGALVDVDDGAAYDDPEDRAAMVAYWTGRLS